jgi:hypothetical protein
MGSKISIYIPTHPKSSSQTLSQDKNRFKNAIQEVQKHPNYSKELDKTMGLLEKLYNDVEFWKYQDVGLAIFADKDNYECFHLPYETTEAVYLKDHFVISPLVFMHSIGTTFFVLDVNLTKPRLLVSKDGGLSEVEVEGMPDSFQDKIAGAEYKPELQYKSAPRGGDVSNMFHGHDAAEEVNDDIAEYLTEIAKSVNTFLKESDQPLLLVGVQSRVGNIRSHIEYDNLLEAKIDGSFEKHSMQDLYESVIEVINDYDSQRRHKLIDQLLSADSKNIVSGNDAIAEAAKAGRIERMYVPAYRRTNDSVRPDAEESIVLQLSDEIKDIETVVSDVLSHGGSVQAVEIGSQHEIQQPKALCRY